MRSSSLHPRLAVGLGAAGVLFGVIVLVAYGSTRQLVGTSERAAAGRTHLLAVERLLSLMRGAEADRRGFLLTGRESALTGEDRAGHLHEMQSLLATLAAERPERTASVREIERLLAARLASLDSTLAAYRRFGADSARAHMLTGYGEAAADSVEAALHAMEEAELDELAAIEAAWRTAARRALITEIALAGAGLLLLAGLWIAVWRAVRERLERETARVREQETRRAHAALDAEVTQRRAAEEEVRRLNTDLAGRVAEMEALFSVIPIGIGIAMDPACLDIRLNPAFARLLRLPEDQNASKTGPDAAALPFRCVRYDGGEIPGDELVMQRAARTGVLISNEPYRVIHADGEAVDVLGSAAPLYHADGRLRGAVGVFVDVTERRRIEEQLEQAQRMHAVGQLAGGVAHDINNSMTTVLGFAEFATRSLTDDHPASADLAEIRRGAQRAADVARQLLAFSRRQVSSPRPWRLEAVISELRPTLDRVVGAGVVLTVRCVPEPALVHVDRSQMEQVLINLAANAADAMPDGGTLAVETDVVDVVRHSPDEGDDEVPPGRYAVVALRDTGVGMDAETRRRAFEPFFTTKRVGEGTGLGLAMVYGIVSEAGGYIRLDSEPGRGTTATVLLPLLDPDALADEAEPPPGNRPGAGERVLVVEDDPAVRRLAVTALERAGFAVESASDGREAVTMLESAVTAPNLVITDVVMPHLSGRAVRDAVASRHPGVPLLFISGYPGDEIQERGMLDAGAAFLQKPFRPDELVRRVRELLGAAAGEAEVRPAEA